LINKNIQHEVSYNNQWVTN